jgi:hypothetical protein
LLVERKAGCALDRKVALSNTMAKTLPTSSLMIDEGEGVRDVGDDRVLGL